MSRSLVAVVSLSLLLLAASAWAGAKLKGWVTRVDPATRTVEVSGGTLSTDGLAITRGPIEPGVFVSIDGRRIKVKPQRKPADDVVVPFRVAGPDNPGRVEFSHVRHFGALGDKKCSTCHAPAMGLVTDASYASHLPAAVEPHAPSSVGRFCSTCHNGTTPLSKVGTLGARRDGPIFTAARTGQPRDCQRCHAPADHGGDFTPAHGDLAEHGRGTQCAACHRQDWTASDRRRQADFLAAERTLAANPEDSKAPLAVGPNNFCVYCHRTDAKWQE